MVSSTLPTTVVWLIFHRAIFLLNFSQKKKAMLSFLIGIILVAWFVLAFLLSQKGFFKELTSFIPNVGLLFVPLIIGFAFLSSSTFKAIVDALTQHWLIAVQTFRLLGYSFLVLYSQKLMPAEFALPSGIGDIVVGITAPIVALLLFLKKPYARKTAIAWNFLGILDLVIAIFTGFFTSPTSYQFLALNQPNDLLFAFPLALIPTFAVPLSILLHVFSLRVLLRKS